MVSAALVGRQGRPDMDHVDDEHRLVAVCHQGGAMQAVGGEANDSPQAPGGHGLGRRVREQRSTPYQPDV